MQPRGQERVRLRHSIWHNHTIHSGAGNNQASACKPRRLGESFCMQVAFSHRSLGLNPRSQFIPTPLIFCFIPVDIIMRYRMKCQTDRKPKEKSIPDVLKSCLKGKSELCLKIQKPGTSTIKTLLFYFFIFCSQYILLIMKRSWNWVKIFTVINHFHPWLSTWEWNIKLIHVSI